MDTRGANPARCAADRAPVGPWIMATTRSRVTPAVAGWSCCVDQPRAALEKLGKWLAMQGWRASSVADGGTQDSLTPLAAWTCRPGIAIDHRYFPRFRQTAISQIPAGGAVRDRTGSSYSLPSVLALVGSIPPSATAMPISIGARPAKAHTTTAVRGGHGNIPIRASVHRPHCSITCTVPERGSPSQTVPNQTIHARAANRLNGQRRQEARMDVLAA